MEKKKKKSVSKKRSLTFRVLYYWEKFVGLNTLTLLSNNDLKCSYFSLFYGCSLITIYSYIVYCVFVERSQMILPGETVIGIIVHFIAMGGCFIATTMAWFIFGFYQNRVKFIAKSFVKAEKTSRKLYISTNYEQRFQKLGINVAIVSGVYLVYVVMVTLSIKVKIDYNVLIWASFIVPRMTSLNTWIIFIWSLQMVEYKFRRLNDKVRLIMHNNYVEKREIDGISSESVRSSSYNSIHLIDRIKLIFQLHHELRDVIHRIEEHFAIFILSDVITQFMSLPLSIYDAYTLLNSRHLDFMYMTSIFCWLLHPLVVLTTLSKICGATVNEANKTGNILHEILNDGHNIGNPEATAKLNMLSLYLLQNNVKISALGFFNLDDSLVYKTVAAATTYLTIMLQL